MTFCEHNNIQHATYGTSTYGTGFHSFYAAIILIPTKYLSASGGQTMDDSAAGEARRAHRRLDLLVGRLFLLKEDPDKLFSSLWVQH